MNKVQSLVNTIEDCDFCTLKNKNEDTTDTLIHIGFSNSIYQYVDLLNLLDGSVKDTMHCRPHNVEDKYVTVWFSEDATDFSAEEKESIEEYLSTPVLVDRLDPVIDWTEDLLMVYTDEDPEHLEFYLWCDRIEFPFMLKYYKRVSDNEFDKDYLYVFSKSLRKGTDSLLSSIIGDLLPVDPNLRCECPNCSEESVFTIEGELEWFHCNNCYTVFSKDWKLSSKLTEPFSYEELQEAVSDCFSDTIEFHEGRVQEERDKDIIKEQLYDLDSISIYDYSYNSGGLLEIAYLRNKLDISEDEKSSIIVEYNNMNVIYDLAEMDIARDKYIRDLSVCHHCNTIGTHYRVIFPWNLNGGNKLVSTQFCEECADKVTDDITGKLLDEGQSVLTGHLL